MSHPSGTVNTAVSDVDVTFNKLIDLSSLTSSQITLTGPNGAITVQNAQWFSGDTYQIAFPSQTGQGTYTIQISTQVKDLVGNQMSQPYSGAFTISLPDLVANSISGSTTATFGQTIPISWTVTNSGAGPASPAWIDEVWLSQMRTLDSSAIPLLSQSETVHTPLAPGQQYTVNTTVTLPSSLTTPAGIYYLLLEANATNTVTDSNTGNDVAASSALTLSLPNSDFFINPNGGDWGTASNWNTGASANERNQCGHSLCGCHGYRIAAVRLDRQHPECGGFGHHDRFVSSNLRQLFDQCRTHSCQRCNSDGNGSGNFLHCFWNHRCRWFQSLCKGRSDAKPTRIDGLQLHGQLWYDHPGSDRQR